MLNFDELMAAIRDHIDLPDRVGPHSRIDQLDIDSLAIMELVTVVESLGSPIAGHNLQHIETLGDLHHAYATSQQAQDER